MNFQTYWDSQLILLSVTETNFTMFLKYFLGMNFPTCWDSELKFISLTKTKSQYSLKVLNWDENN